MASENAGMRRRIALGIVSLGAAAALAAPWSQASAAPSTLAVASGVVEAGQMASVAITLSDAPFSVAGFDLIVTLTDPTVAAIVGAGFPQFGLTRQVLNSSSEIRISAVDLAELIEAGAANALLATVNILGLRTGASDVNVQVIRMDDDDGFPMNPQALFGTLTVLNVTPKVDAGPDVTVQKRDAFSGSGSFTDSEEDTWTAAVDYGDGSGVQPLPLNGASFSLSHIYAETGVYTVVVTVMDAVGAAGTDVLVVEVTYPTLPGMDAPARDLDGDGRAEDVNGNGRLDFADVWAVFVYRDSPEVRDNSLDFDYNVDGLLDVADVVDLFGMTTAAYGSTPTPTPSPAPSPTPASTRPPATATYFEAENGSVVSPMTVGSDSSASGGQYISVATGVNSNSPVPEATYTIPVPQASTYYLWARVFGPDSSSDRLFIGIDGSWDRVFPQVKGVYEWVKVETSDNSGVYGFSLSAGSHAIQVGHGELNARLDALYLTSGPAAIPPD